MQFIKHPKSYLFESIKYNNLLIVQKKRTKYLRFYEGYNDKHLNYCKEDGKLIIKEFDTVKYKRLLFLNDKHINILSNIKNELQKNRYGIYNFYTKFIKKKPEWDNTINLYKINNDELFIEVCRDEDGLFLWQYNIKIINNRSILRIIKESIEYKKSSNNEWNYLMSVLLENKFDKVFDIIKNNYDKKYWIDIIIKIFTDIPFYRIDNNSEQYGLIWLNNTINKNWI